MIPHILLSMKKTSFFACCVAVGPLILLCGGHVSAQLAPRGASEQPNQSKAYQLKAAGQIDKLVGGDFRKKSIRPLPKASDELFLRRTYLSAIGRIPSYDEAIAFLSDTTADKRSALVDKLLDSDGYVSHNFNWLADMLRATDSFAQTSGAPYIRWVKDQLRTNRPYDEMVRDLLTATGGGWEEGNGSVGYYVRDKGMPLDNMANTMRIFLGTRMECAQCHNHPFDEWKQLDFFEMAAFTSGLKGANDKVASQVAGNDDSKPRELRDMARMLRYAVYDFSIADSGEGKVMLPEDYQYRDKDPGEWVEAKTIFGSKVKSSEMKAGSRNAFASWVTSSENPRFTKVIANRMWKKVMGNGLFEPVDNFAESGAPSNPQLMTFIEQLMKDLKYDMKAFQRVLYNTYAYQLSTNPAEVSRPPFYFEGRQLDRLTAEEIWDSLMTLTVADVDSRQNKDYSGNIYWNGSPVLVGKKSMNQLYSEVIAIKSSDEFWKYSEDLLKDIKQGGGKGGGDSMMSGGSKNYGSSMRASELGSPMSPGHFIRQFGQSSREVIEGASKDSDVTQVLSIVNGHVEKELINNSGAELFKNLNKAGSPEEKIKVLFLSILTRSPSEDEMAMMLDEVKANGDGGYKNIASALICTSEFMFMQ